MRSHNRGLPLVRTIPRRFNQGGPMPDMALDFLAMTPATIDSRITFTRGSNATLTDSTGKVTYAPANLLARSQEIATSPWVGDTAGGTIPTVTNNAGVAPDGTTTATRVQIDRGAGTFSRWAQNITVGTAGIYLASIWMRTTSGTGTANVGLRNETTGVNCVVTGTWQRFWIANTTAATAPSLQMLSWTSLPGTDVSVDILAWGAQLEAVTYQTTPGTYVATTSSAYYGPRFDYDPVTLAPKGLLIEEARTNLLTYSEQFDNAAWSKTDVTVTANNTTSPDGTANADLVTDGSAGTAALFQSATVTVASPVTVSVFAKRGNADWLQLQLGGAGTERLRGWFNLASGATGSVANVAPATGAAISIVNIGNGWYRCTLSGTLNGAGTTCQMLSFMASADASTTRVNNATRYFWGAQLEAGAFATSYIPTVASTVTRSADVATMTGTNFSSWFNAAEGTFVSAWDVVAVDSTARHEVWAVSDAGNQRLAHRASDTAVSAPLGAVGTGAAVLTLTGSSYSANTTVKTALAYGTTQSLAQNGAVPATSATASSIAGTSLSLGYTAGAAYLCGHIRQIAYFNTRLPDAQLQALTA